MKKKEPTKDGNKKAPEKPVKRAPITQNGPPRTIHQFHDDDDTNYFMSEPSVSEAESSEYVRPAHIASLLAPRALSSPSEDDQSADQDLLFQQHHQGERRGGLPLSYPNSPGTSLSSWDSPHLFHKKVQLYFSPDKGSKNLQLPNNSNANAGVSTSAQPNVKYNRKTSNQSTSSSSNAQQKRQQSQDFLRDLKQQSVGAVKDARPEDFDSDRSQAMNGANRQQVDAVIRNVASNNPIIKKVDSNQGDETIVMDLSTDDEEEDEEHTKTTDEPLDWEAKHSADDEKTAGPPRVRRITSKRVGHRRSRSGDAAAASLMTGGQDWKGMQIDQLPIPSEHDEDEHDHSQTSEEPSGRQDDATPVNANNTAINVNGGGFAVGSGKAAGRGSKRQRRNQRMRRPLPRATERHETDSTTHEEEQQQRMSRDVFSRYALESPRAVPKFVGRASSSPTNESLSTIDHYTSERFESDSSGHGGGAPRRRSASEMDTIHIPRRSRRTMSAGAEIFPAPVIDFHRGVSDITHDSSSREGRGSPVHGYLPANMMYYDSRLSLSDPQQYVPYGYNQQYLPFGGPPETIHGRRVAPYQFRDASETPDDTSESDYSVSDDAMDERERLLPKRETRRSTENVLRQRKPQFPKFGKTASPRSRRATYMPVSESGGDYPTFLCPVCKTRQREFFTVSSAPSQFQGPTGYLALYFAIYVIAALFIFGLEEGWQALDCVYFAVITLTTAGLGDFVPTSDGAKILCSIFIYFGVACIGLLLGSYLASMLDDKSYKEAQRNRVENCPNCARLRNLKATQMRRQKEKARLARKKNSLHAQRTMGFMSERTSSERSNLGPHVLGRERNKRVRTGGSPTKSQSSTSSAVPSPPEPSAPTTSKDAMGDSAQKSIVNDESSSRIEGDKNGQVSSNNDSETPQENKAELETIDSFRQPFNTPSPEATESRKTESTGSPGSILGSPFTSQILGRQSHTRHMSLGVNALDASAYSDRHFRRPRKYSEDLSSRPPGIESIPESTPIESHSPKSWTQQNRIEESESEDDESFAETTESEISTESDVTLDETARRIKTAKYVFLTLKQALMNSVLIILIGGLGFFTIEGMGAVDSFYFTTVLLTTVGYGDIVPVTSAGKLFATIYLLVAGTVLLHNMSMISFIPLELRKRRIEQAVLTQFGDQLDDAALRELATGPLVKRLQLSNHSVTGLEECTREMFALAMMVRLGKVTETDIKQTFKAFRRLDVDNEGVLTTKSIIAGMVQKHRSLHGSGSMSDLRKAAEEMANVPQEPSQQQPPPPPPPPFVDEAAQQYRPHAGFSQYWFGDRGSLHVQRGGENYHFVDPEEYIPPGESERSSLVGTNIGYDSFSGGQQRQHSIGADVEQGYPRVRNLVDPVKDSVPIGQIDTP